MNTHYTIYTLAKYAHVLTILYFGDIDESTHEDWSVKVQTRENMP